MKRRPKIAVYMSCYNHEKYVGEAVDSILNQTYSNLELFIVNDGSTDGTGKILESYKDERVHYFDFKKNTKFVGAANFLQELIRDLDFDYIATIASDDMWEKDKLEKQVDILINHPEYKACFTWDKIIYSAERDEYKSNREYSHKENANRFDWMYYFYKHMNCLNACSMLMDKDCFYEIGRMNENFIQLGDFRAWVLLVEKYPFYLIKEELTIYRRHETNLSNQVVSVCMRTGNELYYIWREVLLPLKKEIFRRVFYRDLVYVRCDSLEDLLAEKFYILFCGAVLSNMKLQVAMDLYFYYCSNKRFVSILENKYSFSSKDFIALTGNAGLEYAINAFVGNEVIHQEIEDVNWYSPGIILLDAIEKQELNEKTLMEYRYTTLLDIYGQTRTYDEGDEQFLNVKRTISKLRSLTNHGDKRKVLFIIAVNSSYDIQNCVREDALKVDLVHVGFVPEKVSSFTEKFAPPECDQFLNIEIYDEKEHCLRFFDELEEVDVIYFVDCLGADYECEDMLAACPLSVEYNCVLHNDIYQKLVREGARSLGVMNKIKIYE